MSSKYCHHVNIWLVYILCTAKTRKEVITHDGRHNRGAHHARDACH